MKNIRILILLFCVVASPSAFPQGSLTPPGPPTPTMKSLAQIEPRTPISSVPFYINTSGSYYLTTNLTGGPYFDGISVYVNDISIDLNGFTLKGVANSFSGIYIPSSNPCTNLHVRNGIIEGWGSNGVEATNVFNGQFEKLTLSQNLLDGLMAGTSCQVKDCVAQGNGRNGIVAVGYSSITDCIATKNYEIGIQVTYSCRVVGNQARGNGHLVGGFPLPPIYFGSGVHAVGDLNRLEDNNADRVSWNGVGNVVVRNFASQYSSAANNMVGPIIGSTTIATNTSPHANYQY
ncbi:MAG: right-handed parallel beta-helix repeat-containing protein [Verrucomicrobiota bacterium]|nr:right-handed parallel beta-helix repeat-containing protein [Verrucomicrobiota bacterium]